MASPTQWTWVWVNSGSWRWTGRPGVLRFMVLQRVRRDWTELNKPFGLHEITLPPEWRKISVFDRNKWKWMCESLSRVWLFVTPWTVSQPGSPVHGDSPGKNTGVSCPFLLQEIFLTQGLNPSLLHCRQIHYHLSHQGGPHINKEVRKYLALERELMQLFNHKQEIENRESGWSSSTPRLPTPPPPETGCPWFPSKTCLWAFGPDECLLLRKFRDLTVTRLVLPLT